MRALAGPFGLWFLVACGGDPRSPAGQGHGVGGGGAGASASATASSSAATSGVGGTSTAATGGSGGAMGGAGPTGAVAAGVIHGCELTDGAVRCWGSNGYGQLGLGAKDDLDHLTPVAVVGLEGVVGLTAGGGTCAHLDDDTMACWGMPIGDGTFDDAYGPTVVPGITGVRAIERSAATYVALDDGSVLVWGTNWRGELGLGHEDPVWVPTPVPGLGAVVQLAASVNHACARTSSGAVRCWGANTWGELGDGTQVDQPSPVHVLDGATEIAIGFMHACAIFGVSVQCWGFGNYGQIGPGTIMYYSLTPLDVPGVDGAVQLALGNNHSCALLGDGTVHCWGSNTSGELGRGTMDGDVHRDPAPVVGLSDAVQISCRGSTNCARRARGEVVCWGSNSKGQIGDGTKEDRASPTPLAP